MLGKPKYGWSEIKYKDKVLGSASYLTDVAIDSLIACINYLENIDGDTPAPFELMFDAEGYFFGLTEIADEIYYFDTKSQPPTLKCINNDYIEPRTFVLDLSKEIIEDVESNSDDWAEFNCFYSEDDKDAYKEEVETVTCDLLGLIFKLKDIIKKRENHREYELGNLLFGNSRGTYPMPRDEWQDKFHEFLDECGFDSYGYMENDNLEANVKTITSKYSNKDIYGEDCKNENIKNNLDYHSHVHVFDNGVFMINPYYWGDADDIAELPNFIYYPDNIEINWYKYPLRDAWINKQILYKEFCNILDKCKESIEIE